MGVTYRFRSTATLLDKKELEDQYIHFSAPQHLNDPAEGLCDIVWKGDRVVWGNLFGHFLWCSQVYYARLQIKGHKREFTNNDIRVTGVVRMPPDQHGYAHIDDFANTVFQDASVNDLVNSIDTRPVRYGELVQYLELIHTYALSTLQRMYIDNDVMSEEELIIRPIKFPRGTSHIYDTLRNSGLDSAIAMIDDMKLQARLEQPNPRTVFEKNAQKFVFDFPKRYLDRLGTLLYPIRYVACFSDEITNSSMWSHYADAHRGVSLIFATDDEESDESICLNCVTGFSWTHAHHRAHRSLVPMKLYRVEYGTIRPEIDFFRSMGNIPKNELFDLWYTDHNGNISDLRAGVGEACWREHHWIRFFPDITNKSIDWRYERERRLVLYGIVGDDLEREEYRKCTYEFRTLRGVIFGIRTPDDTKRRIIGILAQKCRDESRTDFELYQAYSMPFDGSIGKRRISIRGFS